MVEARVVLFVPSVFFSVHLVYGYTFWLDLPGLLYVGSRQTRPQPYHICRADVCYGVGGGRMCSWNSPVLGLQYVSNIPVHESLSMAL